MAVPREIGVVTSVFVAHLYPVAAAADNPSCSLHFGDELQPSQKNQIFHSPQFTFPSFLPRPLTLFQTKILSPRRRWLSALFLPLEKSYILPEVACISRFTSTLSRSRRFPRASTTSLPSQTAHNANWRDISCR